ncbi:MAG: diacylglycerol kinase family lipid kinase [Rhizobiaceae bacterium]|nr:diacylglycerol kinase family lipid kinase [Rhizobiaceae bacterium]
MRFAAILNKDGGTLKTADLDALTERMRTRLEGAGHDVDIKLVDGQGVVKALSDAAANPDVDVVLAGGGDGTVSAAVGCVLGTGKALAVLPAGTMNLFARSLEIPVAIDAAIDAFADGEVREVDVATANGKPFVHQFSIGMHAKMVHLRDKMEFASRLGKMRASVKATYFTFLNPPSLDVALDLDGREVRQRVTAVGVTNNLLKEGALPFAAKPDGGVLGVYVTQARRRPELLSFFLNLLRRRWRHNPHVDVFEAKQVTLTVLADSGRQRSVMDGELSALEKRTVIEIRPRGLKVWAPKRTPQG